jgi:hypothetical protein
MTAVRHIPPQQRPSHLHGSAPDLYRLPQGWPLGQPDARPRHAVTVLGVRVATTVTLGATMILFGVISCGSSVAPVKPPLAAQGSSTTPVSVPANTVAVPEAPQQLTVGRVTFDVPAGWTAGPPPSGAASASASAVLAPAGGSGVNIEILVYNLDQVPGYDQAALEKDGVGGPGTFGGRPIWGYTAEHTNTDTGLIYFDMKWNIIIDGPTRVDVGCDAPTPDADQAAMTPVCEQLVRSLIIRPS